ncbi:MAG: hypothetical protein Q7V88_09885 [Actinomycetota bacterium]|nr:hypothetical protein [Actinomycetota bacterium]
MTTATGTRDIVRRLGTAARAAEVSTEQREQWRAEHLAVPGTSHIHFDPLPSDDDVADQLARRVAQDPTDARLHVARVNHHVVRDEPDRLFAALVDAFFAFGDTGVGLRTRLLNGARRQIGQERAALLEPAVTHGLKPSSSLPVVPGSMLSRGVTGVTNIVRPPNSAVLQ